MNLTEQFIKVGTEYIDALNKLDKNHPEGVAHISSYPYDVADGFLGIVHEMEKNSLCVVKPRWQFFDDRIVNQYKIHNALWDVEANIRIREIEHSVEKLTLAELEALYYDMTTKSYINDN